MPVLLLILLFNLLEPLTLQFAVPGVQVLFKVLTPFEFDLLFSGFDIFGTAFVPLLVLSAVCAYDVDKKSDMKNRGINFFMRILLYG